MQPVTATASYAYPVPSPTRQPPIDKNSKLYQAAQDFESIFIKQMLDAMRQTLNKDDDLFNAGTGQDVFDDMLYDEYAKKMAQTAQFGLADAIYRQVSSK